MSLSCKKRGQPFGSQQALEHHVRDSPAHTSSYFCKPCKRSFGDADALNKHLQNSTAHAPTHKFKPCNSPFSSANTLEEHLQNSPVHAPTLKCTECNHSFKSEKALRKHLRYSPAHTKFFTCEPCSRYFGSADALNRHLKNSPVHSPSFGCIGCDQSFSSLHALNLHLWDPTAHTILFICESCSCSFRTKAALDSHLQYSPIHQPATETPLDLFFRSFPTFDYDPSLPPATSYQNLQEQRGWRKGNPASKKAWRDYQDALVLELQMWYGAEDDLAAWHVLCRAIGIDPLPHSCQSCEAAVRRTHVNIIDLIEWGRQRGSTDEKVETFRTVEELREYTAETGKYFRMPPNENNGNVVLRHLLRRIIRPRSRRML